VTANPATVNVATSSLASANVATVHAAPERSVVKLPAARAPRVIDPDPAPQAAPGPVATYAPVHNDPVLGLMSGRGLY